MVCLSQALRVCILLLVQANLCSGFVFPCRSSPGGCTNVFGQRRSINVCRTPPAGASFRERRSSFALMMKGEGDDEQGKMKKLRKLAADARSAMSQADDAAARVRSEESLCAQCLTLTSYARHSRLRHCGDLAKKVFLLILLAKSAPDQCFEMSARRCMGLGCACLFAPRTWVTL